MKNRLLISDLSPTSSQLFRLASLHDLLSSRRCKKVATTLSMVEALGHVCNWQRVRWTGGVGSYSVMRGGVLRVLITSTKSGYAGSHWVDVSVGPSMYQSVEVQGKRKGFRYGWCVELLP